ncbi:outer membrane beta-barrel protein [Undibacterium sp. TJN19]|uniref:outer membrane beta-barrel protein n=1 Tax=Undibacterium sp. TJN19 TaxID=3413055 RepID=UPI003BF2C2F1
MKKILCLSMLAVAGASMAMVAHAQNVSVGAAVSNSYETELNFQDGAHTSTFKSKEKPVPFKFYLAYNFAPAIAVEAGYKNFGSSTIDPVPGSGNQLGTRADAIYTAVRGTWQAAEDWSLYGKIGTTYTRTKFTATGELSSLAGEEKKMRLYAGAGMAYNVSKELALTLELEHFGEAKKAGLKFGMDGFSLGLRYQF